MSDLLPPGNQPAPSAGDDPRQFPDFFASDMWPALWPRTVLSYASTAARDAELSGLGPTDRALVFLEDSQTLSRWSGTAWVDITSTKWNTFTPQIRQNMATTPSTITTTSIYGLWRLVGPKTIHAKAAASVTGATSNGAGLSLPFTAATREYAAMAAITGTSAPTTQVGGAMNAAKDHIVVVTNTFGFNDMATGNRISYDLTYQTV